MRLIIVALIFMFWMFQGFLHFHIAAGLYIFVDIFKPLIFAYSEGAFPASAMAIGTVTLSYFGGLLRQTITFQPHALFWKATVFLLWVVFCTFVSPFPDTAFKGLETISTLIIPAVLLSTGINNRKQLGYLVMITGISVGIWSARFGLNGLFTGVNNLMSIPSSQMADNNYFASAVVASIPLQFFMAFNFDGKHFKLWKKVFLGMALLSVAAVVFSDSRGGALGMVFLIMIYVMVLSKKKIRDITILIILSLIIAAVLPKSFYDRMNTLNKVGTEEEDASASERLLMIRASYAGAKDHSTTGVGPYCWVRIAMEYSGLPIPMENHNIWLKVWVELGITGLVLFLIIWLGTIFGLVKVYQKAYKEGDKWVSACALSLTLSLCSLLITYTFLNYWDSEYFWFILGLGASLTHLYNKGALNDTEDEDEHENDEDDDSDEKDENIIFA